MNRCRADTEKSGVLSKEENNRGGTNGGLLPDEGQRARFPVNSVTRDSIRSLVTRVEVVPRGIDIKAARIVAAGPFLSDKGKYSASPIANHAMLSCSRFAA